MLTSLQNYLPLAVTAIADLVAILDTKEQVADVMRTGS